jgi:hypothetical protein
MIGVATAARLNLGFRSPLTQIAWLATHRVGRERAYTEATVAEQLGNTTTQRFNWVQPLSISAVPEDQLEPFLSMLRSGYFPTARVVVLGRFDYSDGGLVVQRMDGKVGWAPGFGKDGAYARQIAMERVESVGVVGDR